MFEVTIVVREQGRLKPDYSLPFNLPAVPREGDYISISRPDTPAPWSEDLIVRKVWWRLSHPTTNAPGGARTAQGMADEIFVECDVAEGPYSSDQWRATAESARKGGATVEKFALDRYSVRQSELP